MEVVAWVSRHEPVPLQVEQLEAKLGPVKIVRISKTFRDAREVYEDVKAVGARYAVVVLPLAMIAKLVEWGDVTWLWAEMSYVHDDCPGSKCPLFDPSSDVILRTRNGVNRHLRFRGFKVIKELKLVLEDW